MATFTTSLVGPRALEKIHRLPAGSLTWCTKSLPADKVPSTEAQFLEDMGQGDWLVQGLVDAIAHGRHEFGHMPSDEELEEWQALAAEADWETEVADDAFSALKIADALDPLAI